MEDLTGKTVGAGPTGKLTAVEWNAFYQEMKNLIEKFETMDVGQADQLQTAISSYVNRAGFYAGGGTANAQTATSSFGLLGTNGYSNGETVLYRPTQISTAAAPTLNVDGKGAKVVAREDGSVCQSGDLHTSRDAHLRYDGAKFRLFNASLGLPTGQTFSGGYISGLTMGRAADLTHDIAVQPGFCRDSANSQDMILSSVLVKRFDTNTLGEGTGLGGWPFTSAGARGAGIWYRFFAIRNADGTVEAGWDTDAAAANLINDFNTIRAGWSEYRQLGWTKSVTADDFVPFTNVGHQRNYFAYDYDLAGSWVALSARAAQTFQAVEAPPNSLANIHILGDNPSATLPGWSRGLVMPTTAGNPAVTDLNMNFGSNHSIAIGDSVDLGRNAVQVGSTSQVYERWVEGGGASLRRLMKCSGFWYQS